MAMDDFNSRGIEYILNMINDQSAQQTKDNSAFVQEIIKGFGEVKNEAKLTNKAMDAKTKALIDYLKNLGVATEKLVEHVKETNKTLQEFKDTEKKSISSDIFATAMTETLGRAHQQSEYAAKHGGSPLIKYGEKSADLQKALKESVSQTLDLSTEKLIAFFQGVKEKDETKEKKNKAAFISNFIDELGRSKLFGGTFMDFIKLMTYQATSWLKKFGMPGKILGVALIGAVPILAGAIGTVFRSILDFQFAKLFIKLDAIRAASAAGDALGGEGIGGGKKGSRLSRKLRVLTGRGKIGKFNRLFGGVKGGLIGTAASIMIDPLANKLQEDSLAENKKGAANIFGFSKKAAGAAGVIGTAGLVGSAVAGVTGGAGLLGTIGTLLAALNPVGAALAAIAALSVGIGALVKNWDKIVGFGKKVLIKLGLIAKDKEEKDKGEKEGFFSFLKKDEPKGDRGTVWTIDDTKYRGGKIEPSIDDISAPQSSGGPQVRRSGKTLKKDKYGAITNFTDLSQKEGWAEVKRLQKEDPETFNKLYEFVSVDDPRAKHIAFDAFRTDYRSPDKKEVLLGRGVLDDFIAKKKAVSATPGWTPEHLSLMKLTSGVASKDGPHKDTRSFKSHGSRAANVYDISAVGVPKASVKKLNRSFYYDLKRVDPYGKRGIYSEDIYKPGDDHDIHVPIAPKNYENLVKDYKLSMKERASIAIVEPEPEAKEDVVKTEVKKGTKEEKGDLPTMNQAQKISSSSPKTVNDNLSVIPGVTGNAITSRVLQGMIHAGIFGVTDSLV